MSGGWTVTAAVAVLLVPQQDAVVCRIGCRNRLRLPLVQVSRLVVGGGGGCHQLPNVLIDGRVIRFRLFAGRYDGLSFIINL